MGSKGGAVVKTFLKTLLVVAVALLPAIAHAAGLGKITVRSALGEPLLAEIELVNVQKDELVTLTAKLASREAFAQARLDYLPVHSDLRFSIELRDDVTPYIKVTSAKPVNEPFVDMLVELTWASGRLLREYTFLLDPPTMAAPAAPAAEPRPVPPVAAPTPAPVAPVTTPEPVVSAPVAAPPRPSAEGWVVKRGDTLSKVAQANLPRGVSLNQMLVALYRANPAAFMGNNMNRLRTGPILRIPQAGEVETVSRNDANLEVSAQVAEWNAYRQQLAAAAPAVPGPEAGPVAAGRVTTRLEEQAPAPGRPQEVLRLSKVEPPAGTPDTRSLQAKIDSLQEENTAKDKALREANERVAQLEKNIQEMQRLLELKGVAAPTRPEAAAKPEAAKPEAPAEPAKVAEAPKSVEAGPAQPAKPAPKPVEPKPAPPKPKAPPSGPSFFEGPMGAAVGGLLVLLLGAGGYLAYRRRTAAAPAGAAAAATAAAMEPEVRAEEAGAPAGAAEEVDSLAEAEVYIAYGRDSQAEEILKDALSRQPERVEIHSKLLEIYFRRGDKTAFEQTARVLQRLGAGGAAWESVQAMGLALDPGNPLYGGAPAAPAAPAPAATPPAVDIDFAAPPAAAEAEKPPSLDFDLEALGAAPAAKPAAAGAEPAETGELVFDITAPEPELTVPMDEKSARGQRNVDVPLGMGGEEPKSLDLSLPSIDLAPPGPAAATPSVVHDAHWQEVATKFDLAKVYTEMGDKDGAREILQEVIREGDAQQQQEAKALLAAL
jgi:pilus assembly protein FimV